MSNGKDVAREGVTFNDIFMFMIAVPLVLLWVGFAGFVIHSGLQDDSVLDQIEGYTTLIAILGGPALLIIKDALDVWKQEQAEKTAFYKTKAQSVIDYNNASQAQAQMISMRKTNPVTYPRSSNTRWAGTPQKSTGNSMNLREGGSP